MQESDWSAESGDQQQSEPETPGLQDFNLGGGNREPASVMIRKKVNLSRCSDAPDLAHRFNALRFLAMNLKS